MDCGKQMHVDPRFAAPLFNAPFVSYLQPHRHLSHCFRVSLTGYVIRSPPSPLLFRTGTAHSMIQITKIKPRSASDAHADPLHIKLKMHEPPSDAGFLQFPSI